MKKPSLLLNKTLQRRRAPGWIAAAWLLAALLGGCLGNMQAATLAPSPSAPSVVIADSTRTRTLPSPSPTGTPSRSPMAGETKSAVCDDSRGAIEQHEVKTPLLTKPLQLRVYLPPCYTEDGQYPVLYLLHGQTYDDAQWDAMGVDETADRLIVAGEIEPLIIVMPREIGWNQPTESMFGQAVMEALVPWMDATYATRAERESRAIGGLSRGAAWAVHLGLSEWETFGAIGAHSLPLFWTDSEPIPGWLDVIPEAEMPRIYLDIGKNDRDLQSAAGFEALLESRGIPHEWHLYPGYHNENYWRAHLEEYLRWYSEW